MNHKNSYMCFVFGSHFKILFQTFCSILLVIILRKNILTFYSHATTVYIQLIAITGLLVSRNSLYYCKPRTELSTLIHYRGRWGNAIRAGGPLLVFSKHRENKKNCPTANIMYKMVWHKKLTKQVYFEIYDVFGFSRS